MHSIAQHGVTLVWDYKKKTICWLLKNVKINGKTKHNSFKYQTYYLGLLAKQFLLNVVKQNNKIDAFRRQTLRKGRFAYCSVSCVVLPRQGIDPCVLADVVTHLGGYGAAPRDRRRVPLEVPVSPSSGPSERAAAYSVLARPRRKPTEPSFWSGRYQGEPYTLCKFPDLYFSLENNLCHFWIARC